MTTKSNPQAVRKFTPDIVNQIGLGIFRETGMADSPEEAMFLWNWAIQHKRTNVSDNEAVFWLFQTIAWRDASKGERFLRIEPRRVKKRLHNLLKAEKRSYRSVTEKDFRKALLGAD